MAKIIEEVLVIKFSKIAKDSSLTVDGIIGSEIKAALEQVAQELVGDAVVVEVEQA